MQYWFFILLSFTGIFRSIASTDGDEGMQKPFTLTFSYLGDVAGCFHGGLNTGLTYMGMVDISAALNTSALGLWKGGDFMVNFQNTHSGMQGSEMVGDLQVFDNIDNANHTYLFQLWYRQQIGKFWVLAGLHDLNSEFLMSDYSCEYLNSSFGIMPVTSLNTPVSIFPKTALAFLAGYADDRISLKAGIYEGDPGDLQQDPYNLDLSLDLKEGVFSIIEAGYNHNFFKGFKGVIKLGASLHSGNHMHLTDSSIIYPGNYSIYLIADQEIYREEESSDQGLGLLMQLGGAPRNRNLNDFFMALGLNYTGLFKGRNADIMGIAVAHASISAPYIKANNYCIRSAETAIEISYKAFLFKHIFLQPNLQYIINPGVIPGIDHAGVAILRIGIIY
jgi:porin